MIEKLKFGNIQVYIYINFQKIIFYFMKITESKAWEHDSLYGHTNNVTCVAFYDKLVT